MPGIGIGISPLFGGKGGINWSSYWATHLFGTSNFRVLPNTRSGLSLPDAVGSDDVSIMPAYLTVPSVNGYVGIADNGALDIGAASFTLCGWIKPETATNPAVLYGAMGKYTITAVSGRYGIYVASDGYYGCRIQSSGGNVTATSSVNISDGLWHFHVLEVDLPNLKMRYYIDGSLEGGEQSITGSFSALSNVYEFYVGTQNGTNGSGVNYGFPSSYSDIYVLNRLLSSTEKTTLLGRGFVDSYKAYYPCLGNANSDTAISVPNLNVVYDAGGNYHLNLVAGSSKRSNYLYSSYGSRYGMEIGYTIYSNGYEFIYVPTNYDGSEATVTPPTGFFKLRTILGDSLNYNLSNAKLRIPASIFDRSNATVFADAARAATTYYDSGNTNDWHVTECNNLQKADWCNTGYKGRMFWDIDDNTYGIRKKMVEIFSYASDNTGDDYNKILRYCGDYDISGVYENEQFYYKFTTENIVAVRGSKTLKLNPTTNTVSLSIDGGVSYPYSVVVAGLTVIQFAYICSSGVIAFASKNKFYRSINNLSSVVEITPKDVTGTDYVASLGDNYAQLVIDNYVDISGTEVVVWGAYDGRANATNTDINAWYTKDDFANVKSLCEMGVSDPPLLSARHIHSVNYYATGNYFVIQTGDGTGTCNWIKAEYNLGTDTWTLSKLAGDDEAPSSNFSNYTFYKTVGMAFVGSNVFWGSDSNDPAKNGIWKVPIANIATKGSYVQAFPFPYVGRQAIGLLYDGDIIANSIGVGGYISISKDDGVNFKAGRVYGSPVFINATNGSLFNIHPKDAGGWYLMQIWDSTEDISTQYGGVSLLVKVK